MKTIIFNFLIISFSIVSAQDTIRVKNSYQTGEVKVLGTLVDSLKQGLWVNFHENGEFASKENYINDTLNGLLTHYDHNGRMTSSGNYDNGLKNGVFKYYTYPSKTWLW